MAATASASVSFNASMGYDGSVTHGYACVTRTILSGLVAQV